MEAEGAFHSCGQVRVEEAQDHPQVGPERAGAERGLQVHGVARGHDDKGPGARDLERLQRVEQAAVSPVVVTIVTVK